MGSVNQATVLMTSGSIAPDVISSGLGIMFNNGYPGLSRRHEPSRWAAVRTLKDNEERYLVGSYATPAAPNVWNTPIVQSSGMPQGQSLLIDSTRVAVLDREQVNVMLSTEDRDNSSGIS